LPGGRRHARAGSRGSRGLRTRHFCGFSRSRFGGLPRQTRLFLLTRFLGSESHRNFCLTLRFGVGDFLRSLLAFARFSLAHGDFGLQCLFLLPEFGFDRFENVIGGDAHVAADIKTQPIDHRHQRFG
jgi:hypothetical protein